MVSFEFVDPILRAYYIYLLLPFGGHQYGLWLWLSVDRKNIRFTLYLASQ